MKKTILMLACFFAVYSIMAQEAVKQKEIGLVFSNPDNFGIAYKTGTDKSLWRFNTLFISGQNRVSEPTDSSTFKASTIGFGLKLGKEFRKPIADKLEFSYGMDVSFRYSQSKTDRDDNSIGDRDALSKTIVYEPGINLILGLNYLISKNFAIGAELLPYFYYDKVKLLSTTSSNNEIDETESEREGISYGLSNTSALLSIVYRF
ncbi:MAG: hypothetical protein AB7S69_18205 [Salinivirgaceae bacterium]